MMDVRLQSFKYVGAGLATISLAAQELEFGIVFGAYLSAYSKKSYYGKSSD
jgi:F0F1-type ATP synthase membrane subunit c/vacuolar-type H+-ATPase subunit K